MKKCDTYMRLKANGRQPHLGGGGLASPIMHNGNTPPLQMSRSDGPDVRLIPQRSDASIPRGRPMGPPEPGRPNPSRFQQSESQSLERSNQRGPDQWQQSSPSKTNSPHPGLAHQPFSQPPPQSMKSAMNPPVRHQSANAGRPPLSDADWAASQRPPPNVMGQGGRSTSRPNSFVRTSGEYSPTANGRHSPPQGRERA